MTSPISGFIDLLVIMNEINEINEYSDFSLKYERTRSARCARSLVTSRRRLVLLYYFAMTLTLRDFNAGVFGKDKLLDPKPGF